MICDQGLYRNVNYCLPLRGTIEWCWSVMEDYIVMFTIDYHCWVLFIRVDCFGVICIVKYCWQLWHYEQLLNFEICSNFHPYYTLNSKTVQCVSEWRNVGWTREKSHTPPELVLSDLRIIGKNLCTFVEENDSLSFQKDAIPRIKVDIWHLDMFW